MVALSATTLTLLSACGASELLRCSGFGLGEKAFDTPSCDFFTGGADLSYYETASIGGPIVDETGTATYNGTFGLQGSKAIGSGGGVQLIVDFDAREISNDDIYNDYAVIKGKFTERGVLTGKFTIENDGIASADINGMVGYDAIWATFDNRSETADGYVGGFRAARAGGGYYPKSSRENHYTERYTDDGICSDCAGLTPEEVVVLKESRLRDLELQSAKYEPSTSTAVQTTSVNVVPLPAIENDIYLQVDNAPEPKKQNTLSIRTDATDTIIMTVDGVDYSLALPSNSLAYKIDNWDRTENNVFLFNDSNDNRVSLKQVVRGIHPTIQGDYVQYGYVQYGEDKVANAGYTMGYATVGIQTDAAVVATQTAVATYTGRGGFGIHERHMSWNGGFAAFDDLVITMKVDFDANTIAGNGEDLSSKGNVIFNSAPIVGNGFEGTFTLDSKSRDWYTLIDNPTGQYSGNFFGPNADDLAGVMRFESTVSKYDYSDGTTSDFDITAIGGFRADRTVIQGFEE